MKYVTTMEQNVRKWYVSKYQSDELGRQIDASITFTGVLECLRDGFDIYKYLGVSDSIVRENVFTELAKRMGVNYDYVYNLWLEG